MVLPSATVQSLLRRSISSSSCRSSTTSLTSASSFVKCLAMTSVMWVSVRAAGGMSSTNGGGGARSSPNSPPPLFQSPLVTAEQVSIFMCGIFCSMWVVMVLMVGSIFSTST